MLGTTRVCDPLHSSSLWFPSDGISPVFVPGMQSLAKSIPAAYPGTYAVAVDVCDGIESYMTVLPAQIEKFAETVRVMTCNYPVSSMVVAYACIFSG